MSTNLVNIGDALDTRAYETGGYVEEIVPLKDGGYTMVIRETPVSLLSWPNDPPKNYLVTVGADGVPVGGPVELGEINYNGARISDIDIGAAKALADGSLLVALSLGYGDTASLGTVSKTGAIETFYSVNLENEDGGTVTRPSSSVAFGKDNTIALARIASDEAGAYRTVDIVSSKHTLIASVAIDRSVTKDKAGSTTVTALADGRFLVTWVEEGQTSTAVKAQVVTKDGKLAGSTFVAALARDLGTPGVTQILHEIAALPDGGFVVSTQSAESQYDPTRPAGNSTVYGNIEGKVWIRTESGTLKAGPSHVTVAKAASATLQDLEVLSDGRFIEIVKVKATTEAGALQTTLKGFVYDHARDVTGESVDFLSTTSAMARLTNFDTITALADGRFTMTFAGFHPPLGPSHGTIQTYGLSNAEWVVVKGTVTGSDVLKGSATLDLAESIDGLGGHDRLYGFGGNDRLFGGTGDDLLDGGKGADRMEGGTGGDTYVVDHFGDIVVEGRGGGLDTVRSSVSHGLADYVENLILTGTAEIDGHGNALANVITGNNAANELIGFGGNDVMEGRAGNDTYYVDDIGDRVIEKSAQGRDTIITTVSFKLKDDQSIEVLKAGYSDSDGTIVLTGNKEKNIIQGQNYADVLNGKGGADILTGGTYSQNTFVFDTALGRDNVDRITDFESSYFNGDKIHLDDAIFKGLAKGALSGSAFKNTTFGAVDADDRILYNQDSGALSYDADGSGAAKAVQFAVIGEVGATTHPGLAAYNFFVI